MHTFCEHCHAKFFVDELEDADFGTDMEGGDVISFKCPSCENLTENSPIFK